MYCTSGRPFGTEVINAIPEQGPNIQMGDTVRIVSASVCFFQGKDRRNYQAKALLKINVAIYGRKNATAKVLRRRKDLGT